MKNILERVFNLINLFNILLFLVVINETCEAL